MRVLITRAENEAGGLAKLVEEIGCVPLVASMMEIEFDKEPIDLEPFQAVVTTSANAIRALSEVTDNRDIRLFCVGKPSEKAAKALGYTNTVSSIGNQKNLGIFIAREADPKDGMLLYLRGDNVAGNPLQDLRRAGFDAAAKLVYQTRPIKTLPDEVKTEFAKDRPPEVATFFSIRTFKLFQNVMRGEGLLPRLAEMTAVCISPAVADFARGVKWKRVLVAEAPSASAILDIIKALNDGASASS